MAFICPQECVELIHKLADAARPIALQYFRQLRLEVMRKEDHSPVTLADRSIETIWRDMIVAARPADGLWGEEFGRANNDSEWQWIMDPIDGTKSFTLGRTSFGCMVGLHHAEHGFVAGVVDQPVLGWRWFAAKGFGATFNGTPLAQNPDIDLAQCRMALTNPVRHTQALQILRDTLMTQTSVIEYGGNCLNYVAIADGTMQVTFDSHQDIYDLAAIIPMIEETGGVITHLDGSPIDLTQKHTVMAASTPALHKELLALYKEIA